MSPPTRCCNPSLTEKHNRVSNGIRLVADHWGAEFSNLTNKYLRGTCRLETLGHLNERCHLLTHIHRVVRSIVHLFTLEKKRKLSFGGNVGNYTLLMKCRK